MAIKVAYIAGPYRGKTHYDIEKNIRAAEAVAIKYWKLGYAVICPHKNTAHLDGLEPDEVWLEGTMELLRRSDVVVMMPKWSLSEGARAEHWEAWALGKNVIYETEIQK